MSIEELEIELFDDIVFENECLIVHKILKEVQTRSPNWVIRLQLVTWKHSEDGQKRVDIRRYSTRDKSYKKGVSFTKKQFEELKDYIVENLNKEGLD